jgi:hypothetical protein
MACNESFTSSTAAILHDSDPKLLRFKQQSQLSVDLNGEGVILADLGTSVDLVNAKAIGESTPPVVGPTVADLTGGSDTVPYLPALKDVTDGSFTLKLAPNGTSPGVSITVTAADIAALAIAQGQGDFNTATIVLDSLFAPGDLASLAGTSFGSGIPTPNVVYTNTAIFTITTGTLTSVLAGVQILDNASTWSYAAAAGHDAQANFTVTNSPASFVVNGAPSVRLNFELHGNTLAFNKIRLTFAQDGPMSLADITQGQVNVEIDFSDASFIAAAIPYSALTTATNDITSFFGPAWAAQTGKQITDVFYTVSVPFLAGAIAPTTFFFNLSVSVGGDFASINCLNPVGPSTHITIGGTLIPNYTNPINAVVPPGLSPIGIVPVNTDLDVPIDAVRILGAATGPQLASQNARVHFPSVNFDPFIGQTLVKAIVDFSHGYASTPFADMPSMIYTGYTDPNSGESGFNPPMQPIQTGFTSLITNNMSVAIVSGFTIFVNVDLFPRSSPGVPLPLLVTEDYEIRQRNRAAFKVYFDPDSIPEAFAGSVQVNAYISQGASSGEVRQWTPCPLKRLDAPATTPIYNNVVPIITLSGLPTAYADGMLYIPAECLSPWNYIKFVILPIAEGQDLSGIIMKIAADAREV